MVVVVVGGVWKYFQGAHLAGTDWGEETGGMDGKRERETNGPSAWQSSLALPWSPQLPTAHQKEGQEVQEAQVACSVPGTMPCFRTQPRTTTQ